MNVRHKQVNHFIIILGKCIAFFIFGGIAIHTFTMFFDYFLVSEPFHLNLHTNFIDSVFSVPMIPMMLVYGTLCLLIYFLWGSAKKSLFLVQQKEIQREKVELVFKSMQRITGILVELIAANNTEILGWVESRKSKGQKVSNRVDKPARNIANALQSLSEFSFLVPYSDNIPKDAEHIEKLLKSRLNIKTN